MSSSQSGISSNNLILYLKALRNYKQTGYIKSMAIIKYMNGITLTPPQVNLVLPGAWILVVEKIEPRDLHEREMKTEVLSFLHKLNQQYKERKGEILSEMIQKSKERAMKRDSEEIKRISIAVQDVGSA